MSGRASPTPPDAPRREEDWLSLRRAGQRWPRAIVTAWVAILMIVLARVMGDPGVELSGDADTLLPVEHRAPEGEPLLLLTIDPEALSDDEGGSDLLISAATAVAERMGERRIPLGPPAAELTGWLDAHALYLLPVAAHEALAQRLTDDAIAEAVDALKARLSSPLYGISGEEPRRDPLRLQELSQAHAGRLTHLGNVDDMAAELTSTGDLLALDGRALLIQLRTDEAPGPLLAEVRAALPNPKIDAALVGPAAQRARDRAALSDRGERLVLSIMGALVVVLSLALRAIRPVVAIVLALGSVLAGLLAFGPAPGPHDIPLLVLLAGFGCEGALHLRRISPRGWPSAAVLGVALLPLLLSPYPTWQRWSLTWLGAMAVAVLLLRLLVPALLTLMRFEPMEARRGFTLQPIRPLAVVLAVGALAGGAWALPRLSYLHLDRTPRATVDEAARTVREQFFDPRLVVRAHSLGDTPAAALERSAEHARQLATLVPADAARVDSPGRLVLPPGELQSRRRSLSGLELEERMEALHDALGARGFRPDAFGEFLRGAADLEDLPTPQAALDGPLGPWIRGYVGSGPVIAARIHLRPQPDAPAPRLENEAREVLELHGPAIAARRDRQSFEDWLGIYVLCQLWLGALAVWLGTRRLSIALACTTTALAAQTAVLAVMVPLGLPFGPAVMPALLLVGAAAMVAGGRACQAVRSRTPIYATGMLLSGLCPAAVGLALFASGDPLWVPVGLVVAAGAVLASGAGLFVAPGMMRLFGPVPRPPAPEPETLDAEPSTPPSEQETIEAEAHDPEP